METTKKSKLLQVLANFLIITLSVTLLRTLVEFAAISEIENGEIIAYTPNSYRVILDVSLVVSSVAFAFFAFSVFEKAKKQLGNAIIKKHPASFLVFIASFLPKKYKDILNQEASDMLLEYYDALSEKNIWRAKIIVGFYYAGLVWSIVIWISHKIKEIIKIIPKSN